MNKRRKFHSFSRPVSLPPQKLLIVFIILSLLQISLGVLPDAPVIAASATSLKTTLNSVKTSTANALPAAATVPTGFQEQIVFSGLNFPTVVQFSPDGRVFVAEKGGVIKVFSSLNATTPTVFADLSSKVYDFYDRGLLGMALDPNFPAKPYVYVLYAHDALPGGTAPYWNDNCPDPPGANTDGCVVTGHLSRLQANGNVMTGQEQLLIDDWCQQFSTHSVGTLAFGTDGALYVTGGEGAHPGNVDYGQYGNPKNPCADPPVAKGSLQTPPNAQGGALRAQSMRRPAGQNAVLGGALLRLDPDTGLALPDNPFYNSRAGDPNAQRIIAYGLRNPFRMTIRPGTSEVWIGDVGWTDWEEINRVVNPTDATVENFGWPCYEGAGRQGSYESTNLTSCQTLYSANTATMPYYTYYHYNKIVAGESCRNTGDSSITGIAFNNSNVYPSQYDGALFFADYSRNCIWAMPKGTNGDPDPTKIQNFVTNAATPVDLKMGPDGNLYYVDLETGTIRRIKYAGANTPPTAVATATPTNGAAPLTVNFDGSGSNDPDAGDTITYAWDLDGDGQYNDSTDPKPTKIYTTAGTYTVRLKVTDNHGSSTISSPLVITVGNTAPVATIISPTSTLTWKVGDVINFSGSATDQQDGNLPASAFSWSVMLHHCSTLTSCHTHFLQTINGVTGGTLSAPDHEYPSYLELQLTVKDSGGLTDVKSVSIYPQKVDLTFQSNPGGLQIAVGAGISTTTFTRTVIVNSATTVAVPSPQTFNGMSYLFSSWSDGGAQNHDIIGPATPTTYTVSFVPACSATSLVVNNSGDDVPADQCQVTLRKAINRATSQGSGTITFSSVNQITLTSALPDIPPNVKIQASCTSRVQINASTSNIFRLGGKNNLQGLDIHSTVRPVFAQVPGSRNSFKCVRVKIGP
jgi:glucose/arabinose dehydrogenase